MNNKLIYETDSNGGSHAYYRKKAKDIKVGDILKPSKYSNGNYIHPIKVTKKQNSKLEDNLVEIFSNRQVYSFSRDIKKVYNKEDFIKVYEF
jgi:hypothetical protein